MGENHDCAECPKPLVELKSMRVVGDILWPPLGSGPGQPNLY